MEATLMLTGLTVGGFLVFPVVAEYIRRHLPILVGAAILLVGLYLAAPYSPEIRAVWFPISQLPTVFLTAVYEGGDGISRIGSEYFNAFHQ